MALCYKDRAYCSASETKCFNHECYRYASNETKAAAADYGLPIAYMDLSTDCKDIVNDPSSIPN